MTEQDKAGTIRHMGCYAVLPNVPFWGANYFLLTTHRVTLNADYVLIGLAALFLPTAVLLPFFLVIVLVDVFASTASFYYFSQSDLIESAYYLRELPWQRIAVTGAVLLAATVLWVLLVRKAAGTVSQRSHKRAAFAYVLAGLALLFAAAHTGPSNTFPRDAYTVPKLANSASWRLLRASWRVVRADRNTTPPRRIPSSTAALLQAAGMRSAGQPWQERNIVLVLVESYGSLYDQTAASTVRAPLEAPEVAEHYRVQSGMVPFHGATVSGEFRALCGLEMGLVSRSLAEKVAPSCLPKLLKQQGYDSTAIHGFDGGMFSRRSWYRQLGFDRALFLEDLRTRPGVHICDGVFPGICDADVAGLIRDELVASPNKPHFVHWVTLNSHLPVRLTKENAAVFACGTPEAANPDDSICNWMGLVYTVNAAIAKISIDPELPPTEFIVVGDHAPPFLESRRRMQFSQTEVPFIHLIPKGRPQTPRTWAVHQSVHWINSAEESSKVPRAAD